jgi:cupin 2 domain-containing protein
MKTGNLYRNIPPALPAEISDTLLASPSTALRVERIVSKGHASAPDFWYRQDQAEWVLLLQGSASLRFEADNRVLPMEPGDYVHIAAQESHRVEFTDPEQTTVWLAIFY